MTAIVDYGVGNLFSLACSFRAIGAETEITRDPARIEAAERVILPGVGAFGDAMDKLNATGLVPVLKREAERSEPKKSRGYSYTVEEYGEHDGLGLIPGTVRDLRADLSDKTLKVPHMGWNGLDIVRDDPFFRYVQNGEYAYYVHSFYAKECAAHTLATSRYGNVDVTGVVRKGMVYGTQFHPEKSGDTGLRLLRAFAEL